MTKQEILDRIGYFMGRRNISAYKIGLELGHAKTYFYRVQSGEIDLTVDCLLEILDILNVTTTEFFCPFISEKDVREFNDFKSLSEENKQTIMELIKKLK